MRQVIVLTIVQKLLSGSVLYIKKKKSMAEFIKQSV